MSNISNMLFVLLWAMSAIRFVHADLDWGSECNRHMDKAEFLLRKKADPLTIWRIIGGANDPQMLIKASSFDVMVEVVDTSTEAVVVKWPEGRLRKKLAACHSYRDMEVCYSYTHSNDGTMAGSISFEGEYDEADLLVRASTRSDIAHISIETFWRPSRSNCCFAEQFCEDKQDEQKLDSGKSTILATYPGDKNATSLHLTGLIVGDKIEISSNSSEKPFARWEHGKPSVACHALDDVEYCYDAPSSRVYVNGTSQEGTTMAVRPFNTRNVGVVAQWMEPPLTCVEKTLRGVPGQACFKHTTNCTDIVGDTVSCFDDAIDPTCTPYESAHNVWPKCAGGKFICHCDSLFDADKKDSKKVCVGSRTFTSECEAQCLMGEQRVKDIVQKNACERQEAVDENKCSCPSLSQPVCVDGITFNNMCEAKCALPRRLTSRATPGLCNAAAVDISDVFGSVDKMPVVAADATTKQSSNEDSLSTAILTNGLHTRAPSVQAAMGPPQPCECEEFGKPLPNRIGEGVPVCIDGTEFYDDMCTAVCNVGVTVAMRATVGKCGTRTARGALCGSMPDKAPSPPPCLDELVCAPVSEGSTLGRCERDQCAAVQCGVGSLCKTRAFDCGTMASCAACIPAVNG